MRMSSWKCLLIEKVLSRVCKMARIVHFYLKMCKMSLLCFLIKFKMHNFAAENEKIGKYTLKVKREFILTHTIFYG